MSKRKSCIKCGRGIDEFARVCPYCNWWQSQPVPAASSAAVAEPSASLDPRTRTGILSVLTFGFLLMVAFTVGAFFRGAQPANAAQPAKSEAPAQPASSHAIVTLVPVTEGTAPPTAESPITTVPPQDASKALAPSDATALPSQQYAAAAEQLRQQQQQQPGSMIDPRSITGAPAYGAPQPARPARRVISNVDTQPVAVYQPVPNVRVDRVESAQLSLVVGTDGRVHDIDIQRAAPDVMAELIGEVQRWRFRPATQNGQPVSARFTVNVTFQP